MLCGIKQALRKCSSKKRAKALRGFFKTGAGEYGEGDIFLGVTVPDIRGIAQEYIALPLNETVCLVQSPIHEERLLGLLILVLKYAREDTRGKRKLYAIYLRQTASINSWDLVDLTAEHIIGAFLAGKSKKPLYALARSSSLWERRIAIVATFHFIKRRRFNDTLKIAKILLHDKEDLIHKAAGWMLREVGKRDVVTLEEFLKHTYKIMPRTMLRYAIEKFPERKRQSYLRGTR